MGEGPARPCCDFCGDSRPRWVYPSADFDLSEAVAPFAWGSVGAWLACDECATYIDHDDVDGLCRSAGTRVATRLFGPEPDALHFEGCLTALRLAFDEFTAHRKGGRLRWG